MASSEPRRLRVRLHDEVVLDEPVVTTVPTVGEHLRLPGEATLLRVMVVTHDLADGVVEVTVAPTDAVRWLENVDTSPVAEAMQALRLSSDMFGEVVLTCHGDVVGPTFTASIGEVTEAGDTIEEALANLRAGLVAHARQRLEQAREGVASAEGLLWLLDPREIPGGDRT